MMGASSPNTLIILVLTFGCSLTNNFLILCIPCGLGHISEVLVVLFYSSSYDHRNAL